MMFHIWNASSRCLSHHHPWRTGSFPGWGVWLAEPRLHAHPSDQRIPGKQDLHCLHASMFAWSQGKSLNLIPKQMQALLTIFSWPELISRNQKHLKVFLWWLSGKEPTCQFDPWSGKIPHVGGATKPMCHNYRACAPEPGSCYYWAHVL